MNRLQKKFLTLLLVLAMICCLLPAAYAADNTAETAATTLYSLGLFSGTGTNSDGTPKFDLNRTLNRAEAVTMPELRLHRAPSTLLA